MKAPLYRVGQRVNVWGYGIGEAFEDSTFVLCLILYPIEDGSYFVRILKTGGYAIIKEDFICSAPDYGIPNPNDRRKIRVVFFGNGIFALPTLRHLVSQGYDVAAVVTMEDKICGRGNKVYESPVKLYAKSQGILVYQPRKLDSNRFLRHISNLNPTIGVVAEYRILPQALFKIPIWGVINLHSSLLPMYRGASTITSAIKDGSGITGVTTFLINSGIDRGSIINNYAIYIGENDSAEDVHVQLRTIGGIMVDDAIQRVAHSCSPVPQSELICDFIQPSHAPKLYRRDAYIPWTDSAESVHNFIRAHSSVLDGDKFPKTAAIAASIPTAWTSLKMIDSNSATDVKIHKANRTGIHRGIHAPGEWFWDKGKLYVACQDELLSIDILQLPGKNRMFATDYHNGLRGACKGFCLLIPQDD